MQEIRNIAIIAHVDHGKTTIVDRMIYQARQQREQEKLGELILDNNDLERERGITILAKNVSVVYKGVKINVIDTPGHSDFGGEVERVLNMADGVILLVDAFEGCMPQTRFVLQKAIEMGKKPVLVINKVDKLNCRPDEVQEEVFDLMFSLGATEDQLDFRTIYGSAKQGWMSYDWREKTEDITPLLDTILEVIPAPKVQEGTPQMLISSLEYSPYVRPAEFAYFLSEFVVSAMNVSHKSACCEVKPSSFTVKVFFVCFHVEHFGYKHVVRTERDDFLYATFYAQGRLFNDGCFHAFCLSGCKVHFAELVIVASRTYSTPIGSKSHVFGGEVDDKLHVSFQDGV